MNQVKEILMKPANEKAEEKEENFTFDPETGEIIE